MKTLEADGVEAGAGEARDVAALRWWLKRTAGKRRPIDPSFEHQLGALIQGLRWGWQQFQWTGFGETIEVLVGGLTALALVVGSVVLLTTTLPGLLGFPAIAVTDRSMRPAIEAGDLAILRRSALGRDVAMGDVVGLRLTRSGELTLRRVIARQASDGGWYLQTRADASAAPDPNLRTPEQVAGVVVLTFPGSAGSSEPRPARRRATW